MSWSYTGSGEPSPGLCNKVEFFEEAREGERKVASVSRVSASASLSGVGQRAGVAGAKCGCALASTSSRHPSLCEREAAPPPSLRGQTDDGWMKDLQGAET